jgi:hypothetical protein
MATKSRETMAVTTTQAPPPALDLAALAESASEDTISTSTRFDNNPFIEKIRDSYNLEQAGQNGVKGVTVQGNQVATVVPAIRNAGQQLAEDGIGVAIRYRYRNNINAEVETGDIANVPTDERPVRVKFVGKPKRRRNTRNGSAASTAAPAQAGAAESNTE